MAINLASSRPYIVAFLLLPKGYEPGVAASIVFASPLFIMSYLWIACSVRQHNRGKHGAWFFLYFLPFVGPMWMLIECGILGSVDSDRYGTCRPHAPRGIRLNGALADPDPAAGVRFLGGLQVGLDEALGAAGEIGPSSQRLRQMARMPESAG